MSPTNYAFVLDTKLNPLQPCKPSKARYLLDAGKAAVYRQYPFTIILKKEVGTIEPIVQIKIDPGSKTTGLALLVNSNVIFAAELTHRGPAIKASLGSRRAIRRGRRNRHTRYRPARFLNRTRSQGWLAPSLQHRVETTLTWVHKFMRFAPVQSIAQELVRFDLQQMENPEISGAEYQQGTLLGYEVREYLLNKWDRKCTYCKTENIPLQVEHIHPKAKGGSDRIANLCLACEECNQKKGTKDIKDFLAKNPNRLNQILSQVKRPLKDAAAVNSTRLALLHQLEATGLPVATGSGSQTKFNRARLRLAKTHWLDAACVGEVEQLNMLTNQPLLIKANGHGTRQMCRTNKYGFPARYVPRDKFVKGFQTGDICKAIVSTGKKIGQYVGRIAVRATGSFNISDRSGLIQGLSYKNFLITHKKDGYSYQF
jgi:5-methylcytosine-specific restriction endonuclease McrA